jgi:peptidoglycan/xylan/chitin deacetylase (PgdA/CDA1 family)
VAEFRLDRFLSLYFFYPLTRRKPAEPKIPILMYHSISNETETVHPYFQTHTSPAVFEAQIRYLKENNYKVISLEEALIQMQNGESKTRKMVVITFDDGFLDFYNQAAPIILHYGFTASVFLPTAFIMDKVNAFKGIDCLTWSQVRELILKGFDFGSHTMTHPQLYDLNIKKIAEELQHSKARIEAETGRDVLSFSYPYAFPDKRANFVALMARELKRYGYKMGVTTRLGTTNKADAPFFLKRIPVNNQDDVKLFEAKINGAYDWLYWPQWIFKTFKFRAY